MSNSEYLSNEENLSLNKGQEEEQKYKDQILAEFYTQFKAAEEEEERYLKSFGAHVAILYDILRKAEIPKESACTIVVGRLIKYRSEKHIIRYLPDEAKDKGKQELQEKSIAKQRAKREELVSKNIKEAVLCMEDTGETPESRRRLLPKTPLVRKWARKGFRLRQSLAQRPKPKPKRKLLSHTISRLYCSICLCFCLCSLSYRLGPLV